jgi:NFU1 iron-sulfur cluster scaffold homolog, mitochondrial
MRQSRIHDDGLMSGQNTPTTASAETAPAARTDAEILAAVQRVLDLQVNPSISGHGGQVTVLKVKDGVADLLMTGGCQGCAASARTLRNGVEAMLRAAIPDLRDIVDRTNHSAGAKPYFSSLPDDGQTSCRPLLYRPVPPDAIEWRDGQFILSPDYLAPHLGLDPQQLRSGLQSGAVVSQSAAGVDEDAGKTRLVVRHGSRVWAAEVNPDGSAHEIPPPRSALRAAEEDAALPGRVRAYLSGLSTHDVPVTYVQLARAIGLEAPGSIGQVARALEVTMQQDADADRPFIAALVVSKAGVNGPARGFFEKARQLGFGPDMDEDNHAFHRRIFKAALAALKGGS